MTLQLELSQNLGLNYPPRACCACFGLIGEPAPRKNFGKRYQSWNLCTAKRETNHHFFVWAEVLTVPPASRQSSSLTTSANNAYISYTDFIVSLTWLHFVCRFRGVTRSLPQSQKL